MTPPTILTGSKFQTVRGGRTGAVGRLLGEGGQGAVYEARLDGRSFAIKWYHSSYVAVDTTLRSRLSRAIERGAPDAAFLWPIDLIDQPGNRSFGYLMRLRDHEFKGMRDLIAPPPSRIEPRLAIKATICLQIAQSFLELHASGFCYQDINFGNIFFKPATGDILICDNDNVDNDGTPASVYGTRKFMAPEIVRHETMPSTKSDLFSMAVLFFYVLLAWHPLDGRREASIDIMDAEAEMKLYGTSPLFLFDPSDQSNGPLRGLHEPIEARWRALPARLRELFTRSFTRGLSLPGSRILEAEWRQAFAALANAGFACARCGFEHTATISSEHEPEIPRACLACAHALSHPPLLAIGRNAVCLSPGFDVPLYALRPHCGPGMSAVAARVEKHPTREGVWGLRNLGDEPWRLRVPDCSEIAVAPGSAMRLLDKAVVEFGAATGTVFMPGDAAA